MTRKRKSRITKTAAKTSLLDPTLFDWPKDWDTFNTTKPPSVPRFQPGEYIKTGFCGHCLMAIEAIQPGGLQPRHVETKAPYGECPQAKREQHEWSGKPGKDGAM